ncbi:MAG: DUF4058 family protein [Planctomycetes bacterium]|nr:DUF4058 family protein [Planctomycetota bacterium]
MPSPFPGMDPYIESSGLWPDFHPNLIVAIQAALNARLPPRYAAGIELHVWIHEPDAEARTQLRAPDVHVADQAGRGTATARAAPGTIILPIVRSEGRRFVKIVDQDGQRIVTAIEVLSPSNKAAGPDREAYLAKRSEYLGAGVNLVEIDLLRGGTRLPLEDPPPVIPDYYIMVCRAWELPRAGFWRLGVRDPLPDISVPLDWGEAEVILPLRSCVDHVYDATRYATRLRYERPTTPRLREPDATWARELLAARQAQPPSPPATPPA